MVRTGLLIACLSLTPVLNLGGITPVIAGNNGAQIQKPQIASLICSSARSSVPASGHPFEAAGLDNISSAGELVEAPAGETAYLSLNGIGHVLLASGARLRLAVTEVTTGLGFATQRSMLAVEVIEGDVMVKLQPEVIALVRAAGSEYTAARGAIFHAGVRDGKAIFDASENVEHILGHWAVRVPRGLFGVEKLAELAGASESRGLISNEQLERIQFSMMSGIQPIGSIETAASLTINSRAARSGALIWGNERIQTIEGMNARASLNNVGRVTLTGGSEAKLMTTVINGDQQRRLLAASLFSGGMTVALEPEASAYIQAGSSTFVAPRGSRFRLVMVNGKAVIDASSGDMLNIGKWRLAVPSSFDSDTQPAERTKSSTQAEQRHYSVRPIGLSSHLTARARSTRQIQVIVTDENDRPAAGVPVIFLLKSEGGKSIGALITPVAPAITAKVRTDASGIASVNYRAGEKIASGSITATVDGTNDAWTGQISLIKTSRGFWTPQNAIPVLATIGVALAIGLVETTTREDRLPVKISGATVIKP